MDVGDLALRRRAFHLQRFGFAQNRLVAVAGIRMVAQPLRRRAPVLLLDGPEHVRHLPRVVAGTRHDLRAEQVRLALVLAPVLQEVDTQADLRPLRDDAAGAAADNRPQHLTGDGADLKLLAFRRLHGAVPENHVTQFVRHDAGHFGVGTRRFNHPAVEKHRPAGEREGIDLFEIDHVEAVAERWLLQVLRNLIDQPPANFFDKFFRRPVVDDRQLLPHFGRRLPSELHVLLRRVAVLVRLDPRLRARARGTREHGNDRDSQRRGSRSPTIRWRDEWSSHAADQCKVHSNTLTCRQDRRCAKWLCRKAVARCPHGETDALR